MMKKTILLINLCILLLLPLSSFSADVCMDEASLGTSAESSSVYLSTLQNGFAYFDTEVASSKGQYLRKVSLSSTMGAGVRVDQASLSVQAH